MTFTYILQLYVFILAGFVGYFVITRVPPLLHTPLMSATNAISAISIVGALVVAGSRYSLVASVLGFVAVACATINVVGGFIITDRMLRMFKSGKEEPGAKAGEAGADGARANGAGGGAR